MMRSFSCLEMTIALKTPADRYRSGPSQLRKGASLTRLAHVASLAAKELRPSAPVSTARDETIPAIMEAFMLGWALTFLVVALIAAFLGFSGVAAASAGIAQILFFVFLVLFIVAMVARALRGRNPL